MYSIFGVFFIVGIGLLILVGVFMVWEFGVGDFSGCVVWLCYGWV